MIKSIEEIYIRDACRCDICGKTICYDTAYRWHFNENHIDVCKHCNKHKRLLVIENDSQSSEGEDDE